MGPREDLPANAPQKLVDSVAVLLGDAVPEQVGGPHAAVVADAIVVVPAAQAGGVQAPEAPEAGEDQEAALVEAGKIVLRHMAKQAAVKPEHGVSLAAPPQCWVSSTPCSS